MDILKHFENDKKGDFLIFYLKDEEWGDFCDKLPVECRSCFISTEDLDNRIKAFGSTKEVELSEVLPEKGSIKSGDFGEMLAYFLFKEIYKDQQIDGPRKWRWKTDKNVPAPYSDVILFSIKNKDYSEEDLLISVESKMKAVPSDKTIPIQKAIEGAEKDYVSRIASSLSWLRKKYKEESLKEGSKKERLVQLVENINRFIKAEKFGSYTKQVNAIAFIDKTMVDEELKRPIKVPAREGMNLGVYVIGIKDLKGLYEKVYSTILKL